jgi:uncharacterized protein YqcC (DUF446 family)
MINNDTDQYLYIGQLLRELEQAMKQLKVWSSRAPAPDAFLSQQPFAYDTMSLVEWVQFVFIPKMTELIETRQPLPVRCGISPMAEEYFKESSHDISHFMMVLQQLDRALGGLAEN